MAGSSGKVALITGVTGQDGACLAEVILSERSSGAEAASRSVEMSTSEVLVEVDPRYFRPTEVDALLGDASKARAKLGWRHKRSFDTLVTEMVEADMVAILDERERRNRHA